VVRLVFGEKITRCALIGTLIAMAGVALLILGYARTSEASSQHVNGREDMKSAQIFKKKINSGSLTLGAIATFQLWSGLVESAIWSGMD
jgi:hypothetical protein